MTTPLYTVDQLPATSAAAIEVFNAQYLAVNNAEPPMTWAESSGIRDVVDSGPVTTFPVSALSLAYKRHLGEDRFKSMREKSFSVKTEEFQEGIEAKLYDLQRSVFAFSKWASGPARLRLEEAQFELRNLAALLETGASTAWLDGQNFFSTTHQCSLSDPGVGTFSNYQATPTNVVSLANLEAECTAFMENALDEQGEEVDSEPDTIFVATPKYMPLTNLLGQALVPSAAGTATVNNPFYGGRFNVVRIPQLSDANDWFLFDSKRAARMGLPPMLTLRETVSPALALRVFDESSDHFKQFGTLRISSHIWYGWALAFPHCIRLIKGA
jgi:hypothetical protein